MSFSALEATAAYAESLAAAEYIRDAYGMSEIARILELLSARQLHRSRPTRHHPLRLPPTPRRNDPHAERKIRRIGTWGAHTPFDFPLGFARGFGKTGQALSACRDLPRVRSFRPARSRTFCSLPRPEDCDNFAPHEGAAFQTRVRLQQRRKFPKSSRRRARASGRGHGGRLFFLARWRRFSRFPARQPDPFPFRIA